MTQRVRTSWVSTAICMTVATLALGGDPTCAAAAGSSGAPDRSELAAGPGTSLPDQSGPSLSLVWVDVAGTVPWAFPPAALEMAAILRGMGVRAQIRQQDVHSVTTGSELSVILLAQRPAHAALSERVMGATSMSPGGSPVVSVFATEIALTLGLAASPVRWSPADRRDFGIALGRVVVHELVHAVLPEQPHTRRGLMAANVNRAQLLGSAPPIGTATAEAFRAALGAPTPFAVAETALPREGITSEGTLSALPRAERAPVANRRLVED